MSILAWLVWVGGAWHLGDAGHGTLRCLFWPCWLGKRLAALAEHDAAILDDKERGK